jgi:hypothetical protein
MKKILSAVILTMIMLLTTLPFATYASQTGGEINGHGPQSILARIKAIRVTSAGEERVRLARSLSESVSAMSVDARNSVSDAELRALSSLLRDPNDGVKMYAAVALGNIGPRAVGYVPDLRAALKSGEFPPSGQGGSQLGSESAIYKAIEKIKK